MDHFAQGLRVLGVLDKVKKHPLLFCPLFTDNDPTPLTTGCLNLYVFYSVLRSYKNKTVLITMLI